MNENEESTRAFKGVWIPREIWLSRELTIYEKLFLVEIDSLDNTRHCIAKNAYFADFFGVSKQRVSNVIASLKDKGFISVWYTRPGNNGRHIRVNHDKLRASMRSHLDQRPRKKDQKTNKITPKNRRFAGGSAHEIVYNINKISLESSELFNFYQPYTVGVGGYTKSVGGYTHSVPSNNTFNKIPNKIFAERILCASEQKTNKIARAHENRPKNNAEMRRGLTSLASVYIKNGHKTRFVNALSNHVSNAVHLEVVGVALSTLHEQYDKYENGLCADDAIPYCIASLNNI